MFLVFCSFLMAQEQMDESNETIKKYRWITGDRINTNLKTLVDTIEHDATLLCKDRVDTAGLKEAMTRMHKVPTDFNKQSVEQLANSLLFEYIKIRNYGCFEPNQFYGKDEISYPSEKPVDKIIINPIEDRLEKALYRYKRIQQEGGWKTIKLTDELYLYPGKSYPEIPAIKDRLSREGYYKGALDSNITYDAGLKMAVMDFQRHHGLKPDGVIGPATLDAMNESVEKKIEKILINLERLRWFLQDDDYFVFVNIPGFFLEVYEKGEPIFGCKVVVGRKKRPTPLMRDRIAYAVLNPYWRAPETIIAEDILPQLKKGEFDQIRAEGIIASTDYQGKEVVEFEDVDWSLYDEKSVPFYFLQKPGPHNFLGYLKLIFPNRFDVYLHDTNHRNLFKYTYRALSSGCVRLEKPIELFHLLKSKESDMTYRDIFDIIYSRKTRKIGFKMKIPVYLSYLSVYADKNGEVYFYNDIYGYDRRMSTILNKKYLVEARQ